MTKGAGYPIVAIFAGFLASFALLEALPRLI